MKSLVHICLVAILVLSGCANDQKIEQQPITPVSQAAPNIDGTVTKGEYAATYEVAPFTLSMSRSGGNLLIAVSVTAKGWVAVGLGSRVMNNASIYMGYVENGKPVFSEQIGRGHTHADATQKIVQKFALTETGGVTTLEISLPETRFLTAGAKEIPIILACSNGDSFQAMHSVRKQTTVKID